MCPSKYSSLSNILHKTFHIQHGSLSLLYVSNWGMFHAPWNVKYFLVQMSQLPAQVGNPFHVNNIWYCTGHTLVLYLNKLESKRELRGELTASSRGSEQKACAAKTWTLDKQMPLNPGSTLHKLSSSGTWINSLWYSTSSWEYSAQYLLESLKQWR